MRARIQRWLGALAGPAPRVLALAMLAFLGMASPSHAQLEPEAFTILKSALNKHPPNPTDAVTMRVRCQDPDDRAKLRETWLKSLATDATGTVADKRKKLEELLDAFEDSFAAGDGATQRARTFIKLRDELLARKTPEKDIERSASAFVDQLRALPKANRSVLQEFGRQTKRDIKNVVQ